MIEKNKEYFLNNPVFIKYKTKFSFLKLTRIRRVKKVYVNERIVEVPFVIQNMPYEKFTSILDLGCAESVLPLYLASLGYKVTGVDLRNYPYSHPNFTFIKANISKLPFKDNFLDVVTCISTLEHVGLGFYGNHRHQDGEDRLAVGEIKRVLKKGGLLILSVPFGIYKETEQQRIYDTSRLSKILDGFYLKLSLFFFNVYEEESNYWQEISNKEAEKIESRDGKTNCICLIKAYKE